MTDPTVSIIIPAYNTAPTLPRAIDSVLGQTFSDYEILVVDDGSKDDVNAAVAPYGERVRLIRQNNAGASAARNNGARHARGRYLAFLDADDFWHPLKLELQLVAFRERPDIALCWTKGTHWDPAEPPAPGAFPEFAPELKRPEYVDDFREIFLSPYLGTPGVMMSRETFERVRGFREDLAAAEDIDLWLRATFGAVAARIRAPLFYVVVSPGGLTHTLKDKAFRNNLQVIEEFCANNPEFSRKERATVRRARAKVYENWGSDELVRGNASSARSLLARSVRDRPSLRAVILLSKALIGRV